MALLESQAVRGPWKGPCLLALLVDLDRLHNRIALLEHLMVRDQ